MILFNGAFPHAGSRWIRSDMHFRLHCEILHNTVQNKTNDVQEFKHFLPEIGECYAMRQVETMQDEEGDKVISDTYWRIQVTDFNEKTDTLQLQKVIDLYGPENKVKTASDTLKRKDWWHLIVPLKNEDLCMTCGNAGLESRTRWVQCDHCRGWYHERCGHERCDILDYRNKRHINTRYGLRNAKKLKRSRKSDEPEVT